MILVKVSEWRSNFNSAWCSNLGTFALNLAHVLDLSS